MFTQVEKENVRKIPETLNAAVRCIPGKILRWR
jgi:hypothetical protein